MRQTIALGDLAWSKFLAILAVCTLVFSVFGSTAAHADANDDGSGMSPPELTSVVPVDGAPGSCHATFQTMNRGGEGDENIWGVMHTLTGDLYLRTLELFEGESGTVMPTVMAGSVVEVWTTNYHQEETHYPDVVITAEQCPPPPAPDVVRIGGVDRYETAKLIAETFGPVSTAVVTRGDQPFDGLVAPSGVGLRSAATLTQPQPVLLTKPHQLPGYTRQYLAAQQLLQTITVVGGESAVTPGVFTALGEYANLVVRVAGEDRYGTAAAVALHAVNGQPVDMMYLASGETDQFVTPLMAAAQGPTLLTRPNSLPSVTASALGELQPRLLVAVGNISVDVAEQAAAAAGAELIVVRGDSDYETSVLLSQIVETQTPVAYVATDKRFPDAMAGAARAAADNAPVFVVPDSLEDEQLFDELTRLGVEEVILLGGPSAVTATVEQQLRERNLTP